MAKKKTTTQTATKASGAAGTASAQAFGQMFAPIVLVAYPTAPAPAPVAPQPAPIATAATPITQKAPAPVVSAVPKDAIKVANATELLAALKTVKAGQTIALAGGNYGDVAIKGLNFASDITIMSASTTNTAKINILTVTDSAHIKFQGLEIGRALNAGEPEHTRYASVRNGSHIIFDSVFFHGSMDGNSGNDGQGLNITASKFVTVQNSRFEQLMRGVVFAESTDITLKNSSFQNLRSDGADFANVQRVTIDANTFRNFNAVGADHPDAIQFWTSGTTRASTDIVISNNQIFQGTGGGLQGIFMADEIGTLPYQNVRIVNNIAYVSDLHNGIAVLRGRNIEISGNTVLSPTTDTKKFTIRVENIEGGTVQNNVADVLVSAKNSGLTVTGNKFLSEDKTLAAKISGINDYAKATVSGLVLTGTGYVIATAGSTLVGQGTIAPKTTAAVTTSIATDIFMPVTLAESGASIGAPASPAPAPVASPQPVAVLPTAFAAASQPFAFSTVAPTSASAQFAVRQFGSFQFGGFLAG